MSESQLDEETLAAQRQEMERLRRVQEQQRIIREVIEVYLLRYAPSE
jgi:RAD54-like protein 2